MITASIASNLVKKGRMKRNDRRPFTRLTFLLPSLEAILFCLVATANSFVRLQPSISPILHRSMTGRRQQCVVSVRQNKIDDKPLKSKPLSNACAGAYA
jgi:hypothetical protein